MQSLMPKFQVQVRGVQVAQQVKLHHRQNADMKKISVYQMSPDLCMCQQFFPATSPCPVAKESGANMHPWWTPVSIVSQALSDWDAWTQLTEFLYRSLVIKLNTLSGILSLVSSNQSDDWSAEWIKGNMQIDVGSINRMTVVLPSLCNVV